MDQRIAAVTRECDVLVALFPLAFEREVVAGSVPTLELGVGEPIESREVTPSPRKYPAYCRRDWGLVRENLPFSERRWFDAAGRLMLVIDHSGRRNDFEYDDEGNVVRAVERFAGGFAHVSTFRYSAARREWLASYTDNGKPYWRESYAYDAQDRLTMVRSVDPAVPDAVQRSSYQYEGDRLVLKREHWDRGHSETRTRYGYDLRGRLSEEEQHIVYLRSSSAGERFYLKRYAYDAEDHMISSSYESSTVNETTVYRYDQVGNLLATETRNKDGAVYWAERFGYDCW